MSTRAYPPARLSDVIDDHFGELVPDPYRWMEDTYAEETVAWVKAENELTESFLSGVSSREEIGARLRDLSDYPRFGVPFERGGSWFQERNSGLQDQPVWYVMEGPGDEGRVLLDPNALSGDGTVAVTDLEVSHDGSKLAYATSAAGSDWKTWRVRDVASGSDLADELEWSKYSSAAWRRDGSGFYYSALEPPREGAEYLGESRLPRIAFHRLGTPQAADELVFATPEEPEWLPHQAVSDDGRFLLISVQKGTRPQNQLYVLDLEDPKAGTQALVADFATRATPITNVGDTFYLLTDHLADRQRIIAVDLARPGRDNWREVIPETDDSLVSAYFFGGRLVCHYLHHATSALRVHGLDGSAPGRRRPASHRPRLRATAPARRSRAGRRATFSSSPSSLSPSPGPCGPTTSRAARRTRCGPPPPASSRACSSPSRSSSPPATAPGFPCSSATDAT